MKLFKLHYFKKAMSICADDFRNESQIVTINLNHLLSLSDLLEFHTPFSGDFVGYYGLVCMANNDRYYIDEASFADLSQALSKP